MKTIAFAAPILKGQESTARTTASLILGDRHVDAEKLHQKAGLHREQVFTQTTPMGEVAIVVWDCEDPSRVFETFATDTSDYAAWFRGQLKQTYGIDITDPTSPKPKPELLVEYYDANWSLGKAESTALCFPLKKGQIEAARSFGRELQGTYRNRFEQTRKDFGICRQLFFVYETPQNAYAIMYGQGKTDWFTRAYETTSTSDEKFFSWWRETISQISAVPMFADAGDKKPQIEVLYDLDLRVPAAV